MPFEKTKQYLIGAAYDVHNVSRKDVLFTLIIMLLSIHLFTQWYREKTLELLADFSVSWGGDHLSSAYKLIK